MKSFSVTVSVLLGAIGMISQTLNASTLSQMYTGTFPATISGSLTNEDTVLLELLTLPSISNLTATTTSYALGGFEPNLVLFNPAGIAIADGTPFGVVASTGIVGDSRLTANNLPAGMYTLALSDYELNQSLTATNLSDGFTANYGDGINFIDTNGNLRSGAYSFTVTATSPTPEPAPIWFAAPLLAALVVASRQRSVREEHLNNS
jgi:hypothetical protein